MLIVALVLAVIGLAALVTAVVTSNELVAWVCIGASGLGVLLLIVDAIRERAQRRVPVGAADATVIAAETEVMESAAETVEATEVIDAVEGDLAAGPDADLETDLDAEHDVEIAIEDHPEEVVHDDPDYDLPTDDEPDFPEPAEEAAIHVIDEGSIDEQYADEGSIDEEYLDEELEEIEEVDELDEFDEIEEDLEQRAARLLVLGTACDGADELVRLGVDPARISTSARGDGTPVAS